MHFKTGRFTLHSVFAATLVLGMGLLCLCAAGCRPGAKGRSIHVKYQAARPQWIEAKARRQAPRALAGRQIDIIRVHGDLVYFGVRNYGLAIYAPDENTWDLYPYDYSAFNEQLIITDIVPAGKAVYAGAGGGLLRLDTATRTWTAHKNRKKPRSNDIAGAAYFKGSLWLATSDGLFTFDTRSGSFEMVMDGYFFNLAQDGATLWASRIAQNKCVLWKFDLAKKTPAGFWSPSPGHALGVEIALEPGRAAMPKSNGLLFFDFKTARFDYTYRPEGFPDFLAQSMAHYRGAYLLGTKSGLVQYDPEKNDWLLITRDAGMLSSNVTAVAARGDLLFLGFPQGAMIVEPGLFSQIRYLARNPGAVAAGSLVAENSEAVNPWRLIDTTQGLKSNLVVSLIPLEDGTWTGVHSLGVSRVALDSLEVTTYSPPGFTKNEIPAQQVLELAEQDGMLWHGGDVYIGRFDLKRKKWLTPPQTDAVLKTTDVEALWVGRGQVWAGVRKQGIRVLEKGRWRLYPADRILLSPFVTDILYAEDALWISSDIGLRRYNDQDDGFVYMDLGGVMDIESMAGDGGAVLWLGCRERSAPPSEINTGLYRYNVRTRHMVRFNELGEAGLGKRVNKVFVDGPFVWAAHEKGVSRYDRLTGEFTHYGPADGLEAGDYLTVTVNADWLFVGTDQGLYARRILEFQHPEDRDRYRRAWHLARRGAHGRAAVLYSELWTHAKAQHPEYADYLAWRAAGSRALAGDTGQAWQDFQPLLKRHPLLLLDLDALAAARQGFDGYAQRLDTLRNSLPRKSHSRKLANAWLNHAGPALEHFAKKEARDGNRAAADRARNLAAKLNGKPQARAANTIKTSR